MSMMKMATLKLFYGKFAFVVVCISNAGLIMTNSENNKTMNVSEKLYTDSHFRLIQCKKNEQILDSISVLRELICQSNIFCSEQNMSILGAEKFKSELYAEYFKAMDNKEQEGLLPVVHDHNEIEFSCSRTNPTQLMLNSMKEFKSYLCYFNKDSICKTEIANCNSIIPVNSRYASNNFYRAATDQKKSEPIGNAGLYGFSKKLPKKSKFKEQQGSKAYRNKKLCVQSKIETKQVAGDANVGFISARAMYQNPLKKPNATNTTTELKADSKSDQDSELNNAFKYFDKKIVDVVLNEIMDFSPDVKWSDIAGLEFVKTTVQEIVIWPLLRPDIFTGLRAPPRGILLFGPPGTGKTLIGKCIATESNSTFFCISASSLASKWVGESEQMVRVLFAAARMNQPSVIFIDEIDSLLSQRSDKDQDFTRKLKTEFLVQFDGAKTNTEERVLVIGATNRPHELDEAARRRFVKRLYVPLPDEAARRQIINKLLVAHKHDLSDENLQKICDKTKGYSGSDVAHLCKEAAMGPIRCIGPTNIKTVSLDQVRPIVLCDFIDALRQVRASVLSDDLKYYMEWNEKFGSFGIQS